MYTVSPEDRVRLVTQQQDEWRRQASEDRAFGAGSTSRVTPEVPETGQHRFPAFHHVLHLLVRGHGAAPRGVAH